MPNPTSLTALASPEEKQKSQNWLRKGSSMIDTAFSPISGMTKELGANIGASAAKLFAPQYEQQWRVGAGEAFKELPRTVAEAALTEGASIPRKLAGFGDVALRSYAATPPEASVPQQVAATALQTAAFGVAPRIGGIAGGIAEKTLNPQLVSPLTRTAVRRGASVAGTVAAFEGANAAQAKIFDQPYNPFTAEHIASTVASVAPFEGYGVYGDIMKLRRDNLNKLGTDIAKEKEAQSVMNTRQEAEHRLPLAQDVTEEFKGQVDKEGRVRIPTLSNMHRRGMESEAVDSRDQGPMISLKTDTGPDILFMLRNKIVEGAVKNGWSRAEGRELAYRIFPLESEKGGKTKQQIQNPDAYHKVFWLSPGNEVHPVDVANKDEIHLDVAERLLTKQGDAQPKHDTMGKMFRAGYVRAVVGLDTHGQDNALYVDRPGGLSPKQLSFLKDYALENGLQAIHYATGNLKTRPLWERGAPLEMDQTERNLVDLMQSHGVPIDDIAKAVLDHFLYTKDKARLPNESLLDWAFRVNKLDPRVMSPNDPSTLMTSARATVEHMTRHVLGMDEENVQAWTRRFLTFVNMVGHTQGQTLMLPAEMSPSGKLSSFYEPSRSGLPNAFMGILTRGTGKMSKPGELYDSALAEFFHSTAHELFHGALLQVQGHTFAGKLPEKMTKAAQKLVQATNEMGLNQREMEESIEALLHSMASPRLSTMLSYRSKFYTPDTAGRTEYLADMFGLLAMGAMHSRTSEPFSFVENFLKFAHPDVVDFAHGIFKDIGTVWNLMKDFMKEVLGWEPDAIKTVDGLIKNSKALMKSVEWAENATNAFLKLQEHQNARPWEPIKPINYEQVANTMRYAGLDTYDPELKALCQEVSPTVIPQLREKKEIPVHLTFLDHFKAMPQIIRDYPQFADMARLGRAYAGMTKEAVMAMYSQFKDFESGKYDVAGMVKLITPASPINKAFNAVTLRQNELTGSDTGRRLTPTELEQVPEFSKLSLEDKEFLNNKLDQVSSANMIAASRLVKSQAKKMSNMVSRAWMTHDVTLSWDKAKDLGEALVSSFIDTDTLGQSPNDNPELHETIAKSKQVLDTYTELHPDIMQKMLEIFTTDKDGEPLGGKTSDVVQKYREYREHLLGKWSPPDSSTPEWHFKGKPGFTSEVRLGDFLITYKKKGQPPVMMGIKTRKEYVQKYNELVNTGDYEYFKGVDRGVEADKFAGIRPDQFKAYNDAQIALINRVMAATRRENPWANELINDLQDELKPANEMVKLLEAPWMKERKLYGGREDLNMAEGVVHYINSVAYTIAKRELRSQQSLYLQDPKMRSQPELQMKARKYFNEVMDPTEKGYSMFKALVAFNYIFFSPSLAYVELTQQLTNHAPAMAASGMKVGDIYKTLKDANVDMLKAMVKGIGSKENKHVYDDPELTDYVQRAKQRGTIEQGWLQEFFHLEDDLPFLNARNMFSAEGNVFDRNGLVGKPLYHLYQLGLKAHAMAINVNTEVAYVQAFRHFRKSNNAEVADRLADEVVHESMHGGGRASRPFWFLGISPERGPASPGATVGGLMYILQSYVYNTVGQQMRYLRNAIKNSKLSPEERVNARKAAGIAIATQVALAGMAGLPFAGQIFALIEQNFPGSEPRRRVREMFYHAGEELNKGLHLANQDQQMGQFLADAGMDGIANSIPGAVDIHNRFELGALLGVDPYRGFNWKNVVGPGGDLVEQLFLKTPQALSSGDVSSFDWVPNSNIRRLAKLASDGWDVRNKDERLTANLSESETILTALGFTPKRVAELRELQEAKLRSDKVHSLEAKQFHEKLASLLQQGRTQEVHNALVQRGREEGTYNPLEGARRVAELVQQQTTPFDPMRTGSRTAQTYKLSELYPSNLVQGAPTEKELVLQRAGLMKQLGFRSTLSRSELRQAQFVDTLMKLYPNMSRLEAKTILEQRLHPQWSRMR